ncbi:hypothetical protein C5S31_05260, partial [ANME-1 cluster archaeon GoMg2]|nr:hypothetical protein [ANME-1 cluster archaeon GoMg2]
YESSADWAVHLTSWGCSEQPEEVSVVSEENSSEWWISEPEEEVSEVSEESSEPVKGVTYRKGSELPQKSSVPVKGVTYRKSNYKRGSSPFSFFRKTYFAVKS